MKRMIVCLLLTCFLAGCAATGEGGKLSDLKLPQDSVPQQTSPTTAPSETHPTQTQPAATTAPTEPGYLFDPMTLVGTWKMTHSEVEGCEEDTYAGKCTIEIRGSSVDGLTITYTHQAFPHENYADKALIFDLREMYYLCGNPDWVMDVDHLGPYDTEYTITLIGEDTLLLQNYFLVDGAPAVSYQFFSRNP